MKNYRLKAFYVTFILLTLFSCNKKFSMEKINDAHITFGSGGGFTNLVKQYRLLEDGKIVEETKLNDSVQFLVVANIGKQKAKDYYTAAHKLKLDSLKFSEPGNRYFFMSVKAKDSLMINRIVWGSKDKTIPPEIHDFYRSLMGLVRDPKKEKDRDKDKDKYKERDKD
jgi:hypothetical protein